MFIVKLVTILCRCLVFILGTLFDSPVCRKKRPSKVSKTNLYTHRVRWEIIVKAKLKHSEKSEQCSYSFNIFLYTRMESVDDQ